MQHPPGPKGNPFTGVLSQYVNDRLPYLLEGTRTYGDIWDLKLGPYHIFVINHPDDVHDVLVKQAAKFYKPNFNKTIFGRFLGSGLLISDGDFWKRQRKLTQPAFHMKRIEAYADTMVNFAVQTAESWRDGLQVDADYEMMKLTLNIVAKTLFDADVSGAAEVIDRAGGVIQQIANQQFSTFLPPMPIWMPTPRNRREKAAIQELDDILIPIINERRASGEDKGDLLSMLLLAEDEDGSRMTDKQIRDEAMTLFLAGHETTAKTLTWTWYLLAQHPEIEAKLHEELERVLGGRTPTLEDLRQLPYTDMVIKESMRLYPPAWGNGREAIEDLTLHGYPVKKRQVVLFVPYVIHRDPRWFPEPERFIPERFAEGYEERIPKYAYIPFGGGARICIGNSFAMMEARLLLATLAQRYHLSLKPGHQVELEPLITLGPKGGLPMTVTTRSEEVTSPAREALSA
jgi:cytochrome P450